MLKRSIGFVLIVSIGILFSCKDKKDKDDDKVDFNKGALLENVSGNIIVPALTQFDVEISDLKASFSNFKNDPTNANLDVMKSHWKASYLTWQTLKIFDFGPIRNIGFKSATGTYPVDPVKINANISNGGLQFSICF